MTKAAKSHRRIDSTVGRLVKEVWQSGGVMGGHRLVNGTDEVFVDEDSVIV